MIKKTIFVLLLIGLTGVAFSPVGLASAQTAASFYRGKTITFVVPYKPGGGYDTYARMIAPYLEKETGATVVVRNMPGGESYVAFNHVYRAKPNGLTLLIPDLKVMTLNQMVGDPKAKSMDALKFSYLCRIVDEPAAMTLGTKSGYKTVDDLKKAQKVLKFGATSKGSRGHMAEAVMIEVLGLNGEIIIGFAGSPQLALATMKGELTGFGGSASSALDFAQQPELFVFCVVSQKRSPVIPNVPTLGELTRLTPDQMKWIARLDMVMGLGRGIVTSPGVPTDRVAYLRGVVDKVLHDKQFVEEAKKTQRPIDYLSGEEIEGFVKELLGMPKEEARKVDNVMMEKYVK